MSLMRTIALALIALLAILIALPVAGHAQQQAAPLFPAPSGDSANPDPAAASPALWRGIGGFVVRSEALFSRKLNSEMAAIRNGTGSLPLLSGILAAFLYGVFHTLAVGHGKTVVVGYFLGNRARPMQGIAMASWIATSHVAGAIVVAIAAHWVLQQTLMSPIEQNHWIRMMSFGAIALIGAWMAVGEWQRLRTGKPAAHTCAHDHDHHAHHHGHDHGHDHGHHRGARHRGLLALAAGFVPCSGAILILTFAIANGILASGLAMVVAIALGMALTLGGLGLISMLVRHQVAFRMNGRGGTMRWFGLLGPLLILVIGGLLFSAELAIILATNT
jgi:ABC-type nickel/cobalt efflux system permease component RcnA